LSLERSPNVNLPCSLDVSPCGSGVDHRGIAQSTELGLTGLEAASVLMAPFDSMPRSEADFDRRTFLDALLGVGFVSTAVAIAYPVARFLVPPASAEPATTSVIAGKASALKPNSGVIFKFGSKPGIVVRTADGDVRAFSAICTHLDCTVQFKTDTAQLWCACHNGIYDLGGNVVSGPPPRNLEKFTVNLRGEAGDEDIVVSRT
jgi:cytochrome b6-f complex iron-sulfur subunit